jgi:hypothetical protein
MKELKDKGFFPGRFEKQVINNIPHGIKNNAERGKPYS